MNQQEPRFASGESNQKVVKVGDTLRKEPNQNSEFVNKVMTELTKNDFHYLPRYIGYEWKNIVPCSKNVYHFYKSIR